MARWPEESRVHGDKVVLLSIQSLSPALSHPSEERNQYFEIIFKAFHGTVPAFIRDLSPADVT